MARRKAAAAVQPQTHPDAKQDDLSMVGFGTDPYEAYQRETDFYKRRELVYRLFRRCPPAMAILTSVSFEIAAQEVYVTPIESNPSATTLLLGKRAVDIINQAMNRPGGVVNFIAEFMSGYWGSKTGAFVSTPRDERGSIQSISIIKPMLPRPYFGFSDQVPIINGQFMSLAEGIWYAESGWASANYFALPFGHYWQECYGAVGYGAFQDGIPIAEQQLSNIVPAIALSDYLRRTILCTDDAQVVVWSNIDETRLKARSQQLKRIAALRKDGMPIDQDDEGVRLHVTARDPDRPATVTVANLRAFPEGFDPSAVLDSYSQRIALGFGVHPRRASPDTSKERFGNASQAAMLNSDEPGVRAAKAVLQNFFSSVLLAGVPLRVSFMARETVENYASVSRDAQVAQTVAQLGDALTQEQKQQYLLRQGLLLPSDVGQESLRTGDGTSGGTPMAVGGWASLRSRGNAPMTYEKAIALSRVKAAIVIPAPEDDFEMCTQEATARYEDWITSELPTTVDRNGIGRAALEDEVDGIVIEIFNDLVQCAKRNGGRTNDQRGRMIIDAARTSFYNLMGSPRIRGIAQVRAASNLFESLWGLAGKVAMGTAGVGALMAVAAGYTKDVVRYGNALRALLVLAQGLLQDDNIPVKWVLGVTERHCPMCPAFAAGSPYPNFAAMLSHTGGLVPGDIRLTCSGNCKCHLEFG